MDISEAINRIAEQTYDNKRLWSQSLKQRRTEFTDVYGIPYYSEVDSSKTFQCHMAIPLDLEYYMRFQFKLIVKTDQTFDPYQFLFYMTDAETYDEGAYPDGEDYDWVNLTPYLIEQTDVWPDGKGYFPSDGSDDAEYYDILDACGLMEASNNDAIKEQKDMLLRGGNKIIKIKSPITAEVIFQLFFKASNFGS